MRRREAAKKRRKSKGVAEKRKRRKREGFNVTGKRKSIYKRKKVKVLVFQRRE